MYKVDIQNLQYKQKYSKINPNSFTTCADFINLALCITILPNGRILLLAHHLYSNFHILHMWRKKTQEQLVGQCN